MLGFTESNGALSSCDAWLLTMLAQYPVSLHFLQNPSSWIRGQFAWTLLPYRDWPPATIEARVQGLLDRRFVVSGVHQKQGVALLSLTPLGLTAWKVSLKPSMDFFYEIRERELIGNTLFTVVASSQECLTAVVEPLVTRIDVEVATGKRSRIRFGTVRSWMATYWWNVENAPFCVACVSNANMKAKASLLDRSMNRWKLNRNSLNPVERRGAGESEGETER